MDWIFAEVNKNLFMLEAQKESSEDFLVRCCCDTEEDQNFDLHCNENPIYVSPEKELHGLSPNFHIHVSVSDLYIPRIGPHIFLQAELAD
jgi:hypothetical protein